MERDEERRRETVKELNKRTEGETRREAKEG